MKAVDLAEERVLSEGGTSGDGEPAPAKDVGLEACITRLPALSEQDISELVERGLKASEEAAQAAAQGQHGACELPSPLPVEKPALPLLKGPSRPPRPRQQSFITRAQLVTMPNLEALPSREVDEPETLRAAIRVPPAARRTDGDEQIATPVIDDDDAPEEPTRRIQQPLLGAFPATLLMPTPTVDDAEEIEPETILRIGSLPSLSALRRRPIPLPPPLPLPPLPAQVLLAAVPPCGPRSPDVPPPLDSSCAPTKPLPMLMPPSPSHEDEPPAVVSTTEVTASAPSRALRALRKQEPSWMAALVLIALSAIVWHHLGRAQQQSASAQPASAPSAAGEREEPRSTALGRLSEQSVGLRVEKSRGEVLAEQVKAAPVREPGAAVDIDPQRTREVMNAAASAAMSCKQDQPGVARVSVLFEPSGRSTMANVHGGVFGGTPVGSCIASHFRGLSVPSFDGPPRTVWMSVVVP